MISKKTFTEFRHLIKKESKIFYNDYQKIQKKVEKSSAYYGGKPIEFLYQPMFYHEKDIKNFKKICQKMIVIFNKVIKHFKNDPQFRSYFKFPELMNQLILQDPEYEFNFPIARFDIFYNNNNIKFCEINTDGTSAMNEARVLQNLFKNSCIIKEMEKKYDFYTYELFYSWIEKIIINYQQFTGRKEVNPNVAIVDFEGEGTNNEFAEFKKRFIEKGYNIKICDPRNLEYRDNKLYYNNFPIDLVYRRATTAKIIERAQQVKDFIQAYKDKAVCVVGGFVSQVIHNKIIFSILHDEEKVSFLNNDEQKFIEKHIPETYFIQDVNENLLNKVSNKKNDFILKPCDWFACHGVYAGKDYSQDEWDNILKEVQNNNYIVQEYCDVPQKEMVTMKNQKTYFENYNYIIGLFLYNEELNGVYTRAGRKNVIGSIVESFTLPNFITANTGGK